MKFQRRIITLTVFIVLTSCLVFLLLVIQLPSSLEVNYVKFHSSVDDGAAAINETLNNNRALVELLALNRLNWSRDALGERNAWSVAAQWVQPRQIHPQGAFEIGSILTAMNTSQIISADVGRRGTQLKLMLVLDGGQSVVFKPQWYEREHIVEGEPFDGRDRHNAEIVAFHLNRLLGFNRVPLAVGRTINLVSDVLPVASERLIKTFFNIGTNTCFYGKCMYCKSVSDGVCAKGEVMEGALVLMLPKHLVFKRYHHPWGRTYKPGIKARWETDNSYCSAVEISPLYRTGPLLLDIIDCTVFDYIIGNADRHHYEVFENTTDSMLIMFDNAKSFGNPHHDEESILAPLHHCKRIRASTVDRLHRISNGILTPVLERILADDPIAPLLMRPHYVAMERRLVYLIDVIDNYTRNYADFLVTDGYT